MHERKEVILLDKSNRSQHSSLEFKSKRKIVYNCTTFRITLRRKLNFNLDKAIKGVPGDS